MLALLLYNTFGLSFAVLFFKNDFKTASQVSSDDQWKIMKFEIPSLPYTSSWQNDDGLAGLVESNGQFYNTTNILLENDTLYVTLKSNLNARDRFFELADKMQDAAHQESGKNSDNDPVKLLSDLAKVYLNSKKDFFHDYSFQNIVSTPRNSFREYNNLYQTPKYSHYSPPPEVC